MYISIGDSPMMGGASYFYEHYKMLLKHRNYKIVICCSIFL